ncbi:mechanosensitive channel MscK [Burkholderiaceae bacterium FT117]|uniref:mechanosensitive channel MscK n=1 Tax=Zeimonas sediminis TaxID=2944268 RepID=UPI002342DC2D|nr:mechanosensitive channel MscK [Zeimonas sediminis]MCM5570168.1 mechanosensitive channel MscK [Zeimonas sediminis]
MSILSRLLFVLCIVLPALPAPLALAQPASSQAGAPAPTSDAVQKSLDDLGSRNLPDAERNALKQVLEQTLGHLKAAEESAGRLQQLKETLQEAPSRIARARAELDRIKAGSDAAMPAGLADRSLAELEKLFEERSTRLADWQKELADANSQVIAAQTRPERGSEETIAGENRARAIADALRTGREANRTLTPERRDLLAAEAQAIESRLRLLRQELAGNSALLELHQARRELLTERIAREERVIQALQESIGERRRAQSEKAVAELTPGATAAGGGLLARESALNRKFSEYLLGATDRLNDLTRRNLEARRQLDALKQVEQALDEQIGVLQGSRLLTRILYEQQRALPRLKLDGELADQLADLRLYQFEIGRYRDELADPEALAARLIAESPAEPVTDSMKDALRALLATRAELLQRLTRELDALIGASFELQTNQKALRATANDLRTTLDEHMFWVPSNRPLDLAWLKAAPGMLERQLAGFSWRTTFADLGSAFTARPLLMLPALLLAAAFWWRRGALVRRLESLHGDVGNVRRDSQWHTPLAILLNLLRALPVGLALALAGLTLDLDGRGRNPDIGEALLEMSLVWTVLYTAYRMLSPGGVAERHFGFEPARTRTERARTRRLGLVALVLIAVATIAEKVPAALAEDVVGILVLLGCLALMAWQFGASVRDEEGERIPGFTLLALLALRLLPLALIGTIWLGYYYTALKLTGRLVDTLLVLVVWRVAEAATVRSLAVAARRLAFQRALAKRQAARELAVREEGAREDVAREHAEPPEPTEVPVLDMEEVNRQSLRLVRFGLLLLALLALYWVWADLIAVAAYLDKFTLYQYESGAAGGQAMVPISLLDVLGALAIAAVALVLARNLPGLLEVLVLSRMRLGQGSSYAATTLLSYLIVGVGAVAVLSTLGVSWDKLQWLVAALGVGLGFGLQEVFANFVSGLIILFEKPVRIGDVVTVGNLSGTVSRIRIRATTITDFDHKEIIVPNKTFVTDQLVNWTLTDTMTRITIKVGVAYGSDLERVRSLLLRVAEENRRVLREPEPMVVFTQFGASTLDHELRVHVRELGDRVSATDEINRRIDEVFREQGIEIAFSQLDVRLRGPDGDGFAPGLPATPRTPPA